MRSPLTDDRIAGLLRETFSAHEDLADPTRLAVPDGRQSRRPGFVLAALAAAAAVVIATIVVTGSRSGHDAPPVGPGLVQPSPGRPVSDALNRARTEQVAQRLLAAVPLLPGGRAFGSSPVPALRRLSLDLADGPNNVTRTGWWTGAVSVGRAVLYYVDHPQPGMRAQERVDLDRGPARHVELLDNGGNRAYTARHVVLSIVATPEGVAVRGDTFVDWRPVRTGASHISNVSSVVFELRRAAALGDQPRLLRRGVVTDPAVVSGFVDLVNGWYGVAPTRCNATWEPVYSYVVRFRTGYGPLQLHGSSACAGSVQLTRRGTLVEPDLDGYYAVRRLIRRYAR